jgi:hypothetical protein
MVKINTEAFDKVSQGANLNHDTQSATQEVRKNTPVYNIPLDWINAIKKNNVAVSSYVKQALFEKLKRDGMI